MKSIPQDEFDLLRAECSAAATMLAQGLTTIGAIELPNEGALASALFALSIGLERLLKLLILLLTYEATGNWSVDMRGFKHNLSKLLAEVISLADNKPSFSVGVFQDPIVTAIFHELTAFASHSRYSNIDGLTGHHSQSPQSRWFVGVESLILNRHRRIPDPYVESRRSLANVLDSFAIILRRRYDGSLITDGSALLEVTAQYHTISRYTKVYIGKIIRELCRLFFELDLQGMDRLREFVRYFYNNDRYYRTRKRFRL